jgi:hypothetical protein
MIGGDASGKSLGKTDRNWNILPGESRRDSRSRNRRKYFYRDGRFSADIAQILARLPQR